MGVEHAADAVEAILPRHRVGDARRRQAQLGERARPQLDLDLAHAAALELDATDPGHPGQPRPHDALGDLAQHPRIGPDQVPGRHRHRGRQHALDLEVDVGGQLDASQRRAAVGLAPHRGHAGRQLDGDLGGAADRPRPDAAHAGHHRERLLERARHLALEQVGREVGAVRDHHDARERHLGVDGRRQARERQRAEPGQRQRQQPDQRRLARQPADQRGDHRASVTAVPSSSAST